jgi:DNA-binding MarR family transcriptional regulator
MQSPECERARAAWPVFFRSCLILMDRLDKQLQTNVGLQLSWFEVLTQLSSSPQGRLPMKQLADSVCLSKSGISRLIDRMADAELVERCGCSQDGRVTFAVLTSRGRSVIASAQPIAVQGVEDYFARHITESEAEVMAAALMRVLAAAGYIEPDRRLPDPAAVQSERTA